MVNVDQIKHILVQSEKDLLIFKLIMLYEKEEENLNCYETIHLVKKELVNNLPIYEQNHDEKLGNRLDNDMTTFQELIEEFKDYVYPKYPTDILALIFNMRTSELDYLYSVLEQNPHITKIKYHEQILSFLNIIPDAHFVSSIKNSLDHIDEETILGQIKQKIKTINEPHYLDCLNELLGYYFGMRMTEIVCTAI